MFLAPWLLSLKNGFARQLSRGLRGWRGKRSRQQQTHARRSSLPVLERLEDRALLAPITTVWVNDNWVVTSDVGTPGLSAGDTVDNSGAGDDGSVSGKIFGTDAFATITDARPTLANAPASSANRLTLNILNGSYNETVNGINFNVAFLDVNTYGTVSIAGRVSTLTSTAINSYQDGFGVGDLTIGDATSLLGVVNVGTLQVGAGTTVTLQDLNEAESGAITRLNGGTMIVPNGNALPNPGNSAATWRLEGSGDVQGNLRITQQLRNPPALGYATGELAPGSQPNGAGAIDIDGNLTMQTGSIYKFDINGGSTAGVDYDTVSVTGVVDVTGASLEVSLNGTTSLAQQFLVINNTGAGQIQGEFAGFPDDSTVTISGIPFSVDYQGGDGNDLVLTNGTVNGPFYMVGSPGVDTVLIGLNASEDFYFTYNGGPQVVLFGVTEFHFDGLGNDDHLIIDFTNGNPIPEFGVFYEGGTQASSDDLTFQNGAAETITYTAINGNDGTVDIDGLVVNYTGLEPVYDNLAADHRILIYAAANGNVTLADNGSDLVALADNAETIYFAQPALSLSITGDDDVTITGNVSTGDSIGITAGNDGSGSVALTSGSSLTTTNAGSSISLFAGASAGNVVLDGAVTAVDLAEISAPAGSITSPSFQTTTADNVLLTAGTGIESVSGLGLFVDTSNITATSTDGDIGVWNSRTGLLTATNFATGTGNATLYHFDGDLSVETASTFDGNVDLIAFQGSLTVVTSVVAGGAGDLNLAALGDIILDGNVTADGDTAALNSSTGSINGAGEILAQTITLSASTGIGDLGALALHGESISASTANGDINLQNGLLVTTPVTVTNLATGTGNVQFTQLDDSPVTVESASATTGDVTLVTALGTLAINTAVSASGTVIYDAYGDLTLTGTTTAGTAADLSSEFGSINGGGLVTAPVVTAYVDKAAQGVGNLTPLNLNTQDLTVDAYVRIDVNNNSATDVTIQHLHSINGSVQYDQTGAALATVNDEVFAGSGSVLFTNDGDIALLDNTDPVISATTTATVTSSAGAIEGPGRLVAPTIDLQASTGIGATSPVNVTTGDLSASTDDGDVHIDSGNALATIVTSIVISGSGVLTFDHVGGDLALIDLNTLFDDIFVTADHTTVPGSNTTVHQVTAGLGGANVTLDITAGSLRDDGNNTTTLDVSTANLTAEDIGLPGATAQIDTFAYTVNATSTNAISGGTHGIWITDLGITGTSTTFGNITTTDGVVVIGAALGHVDVNSINAAGVGRNVRVLTSDVAGGDINVDSITATGNIVRLQATGDITDLNGAGTNNIDAASASLSAGGDLGLDTTVSLIAASSTTGNITLENTGAVTIGSITVFGNTTAGLSAPSGSISFIAHSPITVASNVSASGTVTLHAEEIDDAGVWADDLTVNPGITVESTAGDVNLWAGDDIWLQTLSLVSANQALDIQAGFNDVDNQGGLILDGDISAGTTADLCVVGDFTIDVINLPGVAVEICATGAILDGNGATTNVTAASLNAISGTGVDLDTDVDALDASVSGTGNIDIQELNGLLVNTVTAADGNVDILVDAGDLNLNAAGDAISSSATVTLTATTGSILQAGTFYTNDVTAVDLVAHAFGHVSFDTTLSGSVQVTADTGLATIVNLAATPLSVLESSAALSVFITNIGDLSLDGNITAGTGVVLYAGYDSGLLTGTGSLEQSGGFLVTGAAAQLAATTGIGTLSPIQLSVAGSVFAINDGTGGIALENSAGPAGLVQLQTTGTGDVSYTQTSGDVTFGAISVADGSLTLLNTDGDITLSGAVGQAGGSGVNITADLGDVTLNTAGAISTVEAVTILASAGSINGDGLITAGSVNLTADSGIGDTTGLQTATTSIDASSTTGDIVISNTSASQATVNTLSASLGNATFNQQGAGGVTLDSITVSGDFNLSSQAGADQTATGSILASGDLAVTGTGDFILTNATNDVGSVSGNIAGNLDLVDADTLAVLSSLDATGVITLSTTTLLSVSNTITAGGDVTLNADTNILIFDAIEGGNIFIYGSAGEDAIGIHASLTGWAGTIAVIAGDGNDMVDIDGPLDASVAAALGGIGEDAFSVSSGVNGSTTFIVLDGGEDGDTYTTNGDLGTATIEVSDSGASGSDTLTNNGSFGDDVFVINDTSVTINGTAVVNYAGIEFLYVNGLDGNDTFTVSPSFDTLISIDGGSPSFGDPDVPVPNADVLQLDPLGNTFTATCGMILVNNSSPPPATYLPINFIEVEVLPILPAGTSEYRFDMNVAAPNTFTQANTGIYEVPGVPFTSVLRTTLYSGGAGYGWVTSPSAVVRTGPNDLLRDAHQQGAGALYARTFRADVTNGYYNVTLNMGDYTAAMANMIVAAEGSTVLSGLKTTKTGLTANFLSRTFLVNVQDGVLDLTFSAGSGFWSVNSIEIRPGAIFNMGLIHSGGTLELDGVSTSSFTGWGATPGALVTVSTTLGTILTADASSTYAGLQVLADANGNFTFDVQNASGPGSDLVNPGRAALSADEITGNHVACTQVDYYLPDHRSFDFGSGTLATQLVSPVTSNYLGVSNVMLYNSTRGYGWTNTTNLTGKDRGVIANQADYSDLLRDGVEATKAYKRVFQADVPDGTYAVTITQGDSAYIRDFMRVVNADDNSILLDSVTAPKGEFIVNTVYVTVTDGSLNLEFSDLNGDPFWVVNAIEYRPTQAATIDVVPVGGMLEADGTTIDIYQVTVPSGVLATVKMDHGTVVGVGSIGVDDSPRYSGYQILGTGAPVDVYVRRPSGLNAVGAGSITANIMVEDVTGANIGTATQDYTIATMRRFDFNGISAVTASDANPFLGVRGTELYTNLRGYGWNVTTSEFDRGTAGAPYPVSTIDLYRDGATGGGGTAGARTFSIEVDPNKSYDARFYILDHSFRHRNLQISVSGTASPVSNLLFSEIAVNTLTTADFASLQSDANGKLSFTFTYRNDLGGDSFWIVNGGDIWETGSTDPGPQALVAATAATRQVGSTLTTAGLSAIVDAAVLRWVDSGITAEQAAQLRNTRIEIADFGNSLGLAESRLGTIRLDNNAAGHGWFLDATARDNSEYTRVSSSLFTASSGVAAGKIDLLTVLEHEFGHQLGLSHKAGLMEDSLAVGTRKLPTTSDVDSVFSNLLKSSLSSF